MLNKVFTTAALAALLGTGAATAQSLTTNLAPAEYPPSSFSGNQYVDSEGCVFIRAGIDGAVTWVPRMARNREQVCGFKPSLGDTASQTAMAPAMSTEKAVTIEAAAPENAAPAPVAVQQPQVVAAPAPRSVRPAPAAPVASAAPVVMAPAAAPVRTASAAPVTTVQRASPSPAPGPTVFAGPNDTPAPLAAPMRTTGLAVPVTAAPAPVYRTGTVAPKAPQVAYSGPAPNPPTRYVVRTPQAAPATVPAPTTYAAPSVAPKAAQVTYTGRVPAATVVANSAPRTVTTSANTQGTVLYSRTGVPSGAVPGRVVVRGEVGPYVRVVPRHVYEERANAVQGMSTPKGYRAAWDDDRLNKHRAEMTFNGIAQTDLIWTRDLPRRLIHRPTGRDVTAQYPGLAYPYTSMEQQSRAAYLSTSGATVKAAPVTAQPVRRTVQTQPAAAAVATAPAAHRYVQVGTFGQPANASRSVARLQSLGLPVRTAGYTKGGRSYQIVLAGPFASQGQLTSALQSARRAGFSDAFTRR
ncbi:SPOR domain-containing protein [Pseudooceanicola nanhaiensis]|uniref:SPOR domain-containing protein n=1 Tax=Pseudooceanicola nanhaiensis TaxID=375761 RepID=UPI001CD71FF9|nr:SPOR domain-containing protein [Pseudooceanicola nanhaiensis]MCA0922253.1 SPOR domain-containing protein [Pseudooceanicola nanhaiensis]